MLEQDLERVVPVLVSVLWLDLFDESGENGRVALLTVMGRNVLPVSAHKELGVEGGVCDLQPGSQANFFIAASLEEDITDSATAANVDEITGYVHC